MIISASRRTDIPAFFSDWFFNRVREGYVYVRNPVNPRQISQISLSPDVVDGIVFWTKNPRPMLDRLDGLKDYMYYFQFTLNSYGDDIEKNVPSKSRVIIPTFQRLSDMIGPERVIWRYDPIFLSPEYTVGYHIHYFEQLAKRLSQYTRQCTISFIDFYGDTAQNMHPIVAQPVPLEQQDYLAKSLAEIAHSYGLKICTCAEGIDLQEYGIEHARCIDGELFEKLLRQPLNVRKDKNQRSECGCIESIDIGAYNTCRNNCRYCYANHDQKIVCKNKEKHNPEFPLLIGEVGLADIVAKRKMVSFKEQQLRIDI